MEPTLPEVAIPASLGETLQNMVLHADPIVKVVMLLLALASVICWAIILEKAVRLIAFTGRSGFSNALRGRRRLCRTLVPGSPSPCLAPQSARISPPPKAAPSARHGSKKRCA